MADRLRDLIDLVLATLDEPGTDGAALAGRAGFSRDHLDRLLSAATGETPVALRRRLLLERAAWQLRAGTSASAAAGAAGYGSLAAFSRAFARAHGIAPSAFASSGRSTSLEAPNGVHFHPPAGLLVPRPGAGVVPRVPASAEGGAVAGTDAAGAPTAGGRGDRPPDGPGERGPRDLTERMVGHHLSRVRELLEIAATLPAGELDRPLRPGFVAVWFEGEEPSGALMAERLVGTLEVWVAAVVGEELPPSADRSLPPGDRLERLGRVGPRFSAFARRVRDAGAWDDAFVDALCEPPQAFTYGGVLSHVLTYGAIRREALASVLRELGATIPLLGDPIEWEAGR